MELPIEVFTIIKSYMLLRPVDYMEQMSFREHLEVASIEVLDDCLKKLRIRTITNFFRYNSQFKILEISVNQFKRDTNIALYVRKRIIINTIWDVVSKDSVKLIDVGLNCFKKCLNKFNFFNWTFTFPVGMDVLILQQIEVFGHLGITRLKAQVVKQENTRIEVQIYNYTLGMPIFENDEDDVNNRPYKWEIITSDQLTTKEWNRYIIRDNKYCKPDCAYSVIPVGSYSTNLPERLNLLGSARLIPRAGAFEF